MSRPPEPISIQPISIQPISIDATFASVTFLADRTPATDRQDYFATLTPYRDGAVFIAHSAGCSEWERHGSGDEIVMVMDGETTLISLIEDQERRAALRGHELVIVPAGVWHRFETPVGVKIMSVTPQPTDHQVDRPV